MSSTVTLAIAETGVRFRNSVVCAGLPKCAACSGCLSSSCQNVSFTGSRGSRLPTAAWMSDEASAIFASRISSFAFDVI